ncbi:PREDICTED: uncharacterized protein LOC108565555 isoform X2 [Nicrophorus vespilloides]|uniref:Uncharacterized protein LOC108565555 isoform X2 n=1 Tax=Nicrophorus vespilloides TaxID=110193 RepID=A0ABM1N175_NICVS|nr:PREDICTED: uncharacterized protein LOC108565555 isoform X2 [Nicrophorus vespilloides]
MPVVLECKSPLFLYTEDDVNKILENHGKKLKDLEVDLVSIKEWFKTQPHIPITPSDRLIIFFMLMNKFLIEKTKSRLEMNYSIRNVMPELYCLSPLHPKIRESHRYFKVIGMPKLTKGLRRLCIIKYFDDVSFNITTIISRTIMSMEIFALYDINNGNEYICDYTNVNLSLISKIKPTDIMKLMRLSDKVYANRFSVVHFINVSAAGETLFNMFKMCMKPKLRQRMLVHKNIESLKEFYSLDMLPKDYGGTAKSLDEISEDFQEFLESYDEYLSKWIKIRVDAKLRPEPLVNDDILGYYGNFKKLDVD